MLLRDSNNSNAALKKRNTVLVKNVIISGNKILDLRHISVPTNHCKADSVWLTESTALLISSPSLTFTRHAGPFSPGKGKFRSSGGEQLGEMT